MFVGLMVAIGAIAVAPAAALAASPPTLTSSFTPTSITVGNTSALSFTITNPNSSGSLTGIAFTDALPAGLVVDNPNGTNGTCGSTSVLTAAPGSGTISLTAREAGRRCQLHGLGGCDVEHGRHVLQQHRRGELDRRRIRQRRHAGADRVRQSDRLGHLAEGRPEVRLRPEGDRALHLQGGHGSTGALRLLWRRFQRRPGRHLDSRRADVQRKRDHGRRLGRHADDRLHGASRQPHHDHARESDSERHRQLLGQGSR